MFDREFYIFPCMHAFHRECIASMMRDKNYKPSDAKVLLMKNQLVGHYNKINEQYKKFNPAAEQAASEQPRAQNQETSLFKGLSDFFSDITLKGGVPANMSMKDELQFNHLLPKSADPVSMRLMQEHLNRIDDILKKECIFCGPVMLDMIDNEIQYDEFKEIVGKPLGQIEDEWTIY